MKKFLKALAMGAAYFGIFMGIQFLVTLAGTLILLGNLVYSQGMDLFQNVDRFHQTLMSGMVQNVTAMVLLSNILTMAGFFLYYRLKHRSLSKTIGLHRTSVRNLSMSVIFGFGVCFFMDLVTGLLPIPEQTMEAFETQHGLLWFGDAGLTFLSVALVGPVSEEICFRGLCYQALKKGMKPWAAALISSVFFGLAHGDPVWFLVGFLAGIFLSWVQEVTGSLYCAIAVHVTNNALSSLTAYLNIPQPIYRVFIYGSVIIVLFSGFSLYRWNKMQKNPQISDCA